MRRIYLASASKARKTLLRQCGLPFQVVVSAVKEKRRRGAASFSGLAKQNALAKAKDAARRVSSGVIIGADTFVVAGKRIFGKPKNLKNAEAMLKRLSGTPQTLYTGIAIIDKDTHKTLLGCEKTKIYMDALSANEIRAYFARTSPMDKAGSFDIQGKGAFFIRRIEGCYYNVVGLPLRKLYRMLKRVGIRLLLLLVFMPMAGCMTEYSVATKQEETFLYSTDKEVQMGRSIIREVEKEYEPVEDPLIQKRVEDIGAKIVSVCDRKEIDYHFKVLETDEVNAFALPGGFVYVNKGLIDRVSNDDELAGVLGHEVAHIVARHSIKKLQAYQGYSLLRLLIAVAPTSGKGAVGAAADVAFAEILSGYSREDELLADELGARYTKLSGYDPQGMIDFLEKLEDIHRRKPLQPRSYFKTHPYVPDRIRVVKQELGQKMDFKDYINIEDKGR